MNNISVTTSVSPDPAKAARDHLAAAKAFRLALSEEYSKPKRTAHGQPRENAAAIADLHDNIRFGLKVAEIEATLAVVQALDAALNGRKSG